MVKQELLVKLAELKKKYNAIILAHNYQIPEVQDIADYLGDSFGLSQKAAVTEADLIVFCGVDFMAESAKILAPAKTVILPEKEAFCPMAEMVDADSLKKKKKEYPEATVISYVNSSAAVKAESDICCTSSNALDIVEAVDNDQILFVPDQNLGQYVKARSKKEIILWPGFCATHHRVKKEEVLKVRETLPGVPIVVHPECAPEVVALADHADSTAGILRYARDSKADTIIIGTEQGLLHRLKKENPDKTFYLLSPRLICPNMKKTTLEKVVNALEKQETKIEIAKEISLKAYSALDKMLQLSKK